MLPGFSFTVFLAAVIMTVGCATAHLIPSHVMPKGRLSSDSPLHKRSNAYKNPQWKVMPGTLKHVQLDGSIVCGIDGVNDAYCADQNIFSNPNWSRVPGNMKLVQVSVSDRRLYGLALDGSVWYGENYKAPNWKPVQGQFKYIDFHGNVVCGVLLADDTVWCADLGTDFANPRWFGVNAILRTVSVNFGELSGVGLNGDVFYNPSFKNPLSWTQLKGSMKQVEARGQYFCGVDAANQVYCADDAKTNWVKLNGKLKQVSVSGGALYGIDESGKVYSAN